MRRRGRRGERRRGGLPEILASQSMGTGGSAGWGAPVIRVLDSRGALIGLPAGLVMALWLTGRLRVISGVVA